MNLCWSCLLVCVGRSVKVGLARSHDITRLRGLSASRAAPTPPPPGSPHPLTFQTPLHSSESLCLSPTLTLAFPLASKQQNKELAERQQLG
ncbi:hypothetical protein ATANTOWER_012858 [Ataeniobius toweri]|uniref:Secreted protein n=1 Tax=Ataeniobius toweri TaxID=208326 RepID=A0ABU7A610_9TELE|nr:hypothetical protein [Ataeniobius toweri]